MCNGLLVEVAELGVSIRAITRDSSQIVADSETIRPIARCNRHKSDIVRVRRDTGKVAKDDGTVHCFGQPTLHPLIRRFRQRGVQGAIPGAYAIGCPRRRASRSTGIRPKKPIELFFGLVPAVLAHAAREPVRPVFFQRDRYEARSHHRTYNRAALDDQRRE